MAVGIPGARAATYTVDTTADTTIVDGCVTQSPCTLRDAINAANMNPGPDTIAFDIPAGFADPVHGKFTVATLTSLPPSFEQVSIDATTQPGFTEEPLIELQGPGILGPAPGAQWGLVLDGHTHSEIRGFVLNGYFEAIVMFEGGQHVVAGNWLGTDATGLLPRPNGRSVEILFSELNRVGGPSAADRNIISGNSDGSTNRYFVVLAFLSNRNVIEGNWIGLDKTGLAALPNNGEAVLFYLSNQNVIGGSGSRRNIISATQKQQALQIEDSAENLVFNNCFGTNKDCVVDSAGIDDSPFANGSVSPSHFTIAILAASPPGSADGNRIENNVIAQNGRGGVIVGAVNFGGGPPTIRDTVIKDNTVVNSRFWSIELETANLDFTDFPNVPEVLPSISGTVISGNGITNEGSLSPDGITIGANVSDLLIEDNAIGDSAAAIIYRENVTNSKIINNSIGVDWDGNPTPNLRGILMAPTFADPGTNFVWGIPHPGSSNHLIEGNVIANNLDPTFGVGIMVGSDVGPFVPEVPPGIPDATSGSFKNVTIINNAIYDNALPGIDLTTDAINFGDETNPFVQAVPDGVTPNDPDQQNDADTGANALQNFPEVKVAKYKNNVLEIHAKLQSEPGATYAVHFYLSESDAREGKVPVGYAELQTNAINGKGNIVIERPVPVGASLEGAFMTATATKLCDIDILTCPYGYEGTSEFSAPREVEAAD
jgi:CSLREA domain-containing protein